MVPVTEERNEEQQTIPENRDRNYCVQFSHKIDLLLYNKDDRLNNLYILYINEQTYLTRILKVIFL